MSEIYNFDSVPSRRETESLKWNAYDEDVLPAWVADMDFVSPEPVLRALQERVAHGVFGYPRYTAELRQVIVDRLQERYAWTVQPDALLFYPGVVTAFNLAAQAFAVPDGKVLIQPPVYPPMLAAPGLAGMQVLEAPLVQNAPGKAWEIDWGAFEDAIAQKPAMFLLCSPHNPTGRVFHRHELERMLELCMQYGVPVCSDEIHAELTYPGNVHIPTAALAAEAAQHTITLIAPSKTFNIAGLQFSVAIVPNPEMRRKLQNATRGLVGFVNLMGQVAALAAYKEGQPWLDQVLEYLRGNRDWLAANLGSYLPGAHMAIPEATYLAWINCRRLNLPQDPYTFFLEQGRVALSDGKSFGSGGEGFVRLNFGTSRANLIQTLERMQLALAAVRQA